MSVLVLKYPMGDKRLDARQVAKSSTAWSHRKAPVWERESTRNNIMHVSQISMGPGSIEINSEQRCRHKEAARDGRVMKKMMRMMSERENTRTQSPDRTHSSFDSITVTYQSQWYIISAVMMALHVRAMMAAMAHCRHRPFMMTDVFCACRRRRLSKSGTVVNLHRSTEFAKSLKYSKNQ